jgi:dihydropteroate synthase
MLVPSGLPNHLAETTRTLVMGVLNVTPDSFSDGGKFSETEIAVSHALQMIADGADLIDIGGESTRPGAERISVQTELDRVIPVISELTKQNIPVSIDTMRAEVASAAVSAGACIVNDVSGGKADPDMFKFLATNQVPYIMMHWRGHSTEMMNLTNYDDVVLDVCDELQAQVNNAVSAGVALNRIVLDPGIGFAKTTEQNWPILAQLDELQNLGLPLLIGASRKKFLGELLAKDGVARETDGREAATAAITTLMAAQQVWAVRVHDVKSSADAVRVVHRIQQEQGNG